MKRCFSAVLILALLGTMLLSPALAEEVDILTENDAEDSVAEVILSNDWDLNGESAEDGPEQTDLDVGEAPPAVMAAEVEEDAAAEDAVLSQSSAAQPATDIALSATSLTIGVKEKYMGLDVAPVPNGSALPKITWRSANKKIAKVNSETGVITGVKKGTTKIYAKIEGNDKEVVCKVRVKAKPKKVKLSPKTLTLGVDMAYQMKASVPKGCASGTMSFSSSETDVAVVDANGVVTALKPGKTTITVKTYNRKTAKCKLEVLDAPASVAFPDDAMPLTVDQTVALSAQALTSDGVVTPATITFAIDSHSPDPGCVALNPETGELTGLSKGRAIIVATAHNGATGWCVVDVDVAPAAIKLNLSSVSIGAKELYVGLLPELEAPSGSMTCSQSITWSTSNKKVAKVDSHTGAITGVKAGKSCTITATTPNGLSAKCKVKVYKAPTKKTVSIKQTNAVLKVGKCGQFTIKFSKGYGGSVTFESADPSIASVDNNGIVTGIKVGTTTITMTTYNGVQKTATLTIEKADDSDPDDGKTSDANQEKIDYLLEIAQTQLGKPYKHGFGYFATNPKAFDCSGFVAWCYYQIGIKLKATAYKQGYDSRYPKIAYNDLRPGDVLVFNTVKDKDLSDHTAIYLGGYKFIHASSSGKKVMISSLKKNYYKRNFSWGRRILN